MVMPFDTSFLKDYSGVKDKLFICIRNKGNHQEDLDDIPHEEFLDFLITAHIDVSDLAGSPSSIKVNRFLLELWGVSCEQLFTDAKASSPAVKPPITSSLGGAMGMFGLYSPSLEAAEEESPFRLMLASTKDFVNGAVVILYPGFLAEISKGKDLFLLPSSLHEWLYLPYSDLYTAQELSDLVQSVNEEIVQPEEVLSDHVYFYDAGRDEVRML